MNCMYPLKLDYIPVSTIWGGNNLNRIYGKNKPDEKIGETWELSVREKQMCRIVNGDLSGMTVKEYINTYGNAVVSDSYDGGRFPLLVKFIDATDRLSIQVHPDDDYALRVENDFGKTEMWYVLDAEKDAELIYGMKSGCDSTALKTSLDNGNIGDSLNFVKVKKGDVFFIPSGTVHAIGKGIVIAEIQQNCDLTYRVYDYGRLGNDGKPRQLHTEKALDVIRNYSEDEIDGIRYERGRESDEVLACCRYFTVRRINTAYGLKFNADGKSFHSLLCMSGKAIIKYNGVDYHITSGESWFIPATLGEYTVVGKAEILHITL